MSAKLCKNITDSMKMVKSPGKNMLNAAHTNTKRGLAPAVSGQVISNIIGDAYDGT